MTPERTAKIKRVLNYRQPDIAVVMENVNDPHNISAVMRTCDAIGVQDIYILNNSILQHRKFGKKSSASAINWLTIRKYEDTRLCMNTLKEKYDKIYATHLGIASQSLYDLNLAQSIALVFGNEHAGVTEECLAYCDGNFIIPQVGMIQSLNISVACAVTLYEAFRQRQIAGFYTGAPRLNNDDFNQLSQQWGLYPENT